MSANDHDDDPVEATSEPVHPFYTIHGDATTGTSVQAGWITESGDIDYLVLDATDLPASRVPQAFELAYGWYVDQLNALTQDPTPEPDETEEDAAAEVIDG